MKISEALELKEREIVSFVGGGGKTSLMFRLAEEIPLQYRVIITTTTKIFYPPPDKFPLVQLERGGLLEKELSGYFRSRLRPVVGLRLLENNKLKGILPEQLSLLRNFAEFILVEADGSRGLSLKGYLDYEPVIPGSSTVLVVVIGADILGKTLDSKYVHRPEVVSSLTGRKVGSIIDAEMVAELITHPEGVLRGSPLSARVLSFINKVDSLEKMDEGYRLGKLLLGKKIKKVILGSAIAEDPVVDILAC